MATRQDVAALAGVSVATVSYVMNGTKNVTPEVRRRVESAIAQLNYRPNLLARSLSTKETRHVAMLVDNLNNPHYCEMLSGAQAIAAEKGYIVSVISIDLASPCDVLDLASRGLDGVILALATENTTVQSMLPPGFPVISPGRFIGFDYSQAFESLLDSLLLNGHRDIAFLSGLPIASPQHWRYRAWRDALARRRLPLREELIVDGLPTAATDEAEGVRAVRELLARGVPFTAVYAVNDLMALGAMRELRRTGLRVPEDVSLAGCDRLQVLRYVTPSLATMDVHTFETGRQLMQMLLEEINGVPHEKRTIHVEFVNGESIGPAPAR